MTLAQRARRKRWAISLCIFQTPDENSVVLDFGGSGTAVQYAPVTRSICKNNGSPPVAAGPVTGGQPCGKRGSDSPVNWG